MGNCPNCGDRLPFRRLVRLNSRNAILCQKCGRWIRVASKRRASLFGGLVGGLTVVTMYWILYSSFSPIAVAAFMSVLAFAILSVNLLKLEVGPPPQPTIIPWRAEVVQDGVLKSSLALTYLASAWFIVLGVMHFSGRSLLVSLGLAPTFPDPLSIAAFSGSLMAFNLILEAVTVVISIMLCYVIYRVGSHLENNALRISAILGVGFQAMILALTPVAIQAQTGYELLYPMNVMYFLHFNDLQVITFNALGAGFLIGLAVGYMTMGDKARMDEFTAVGALNLAALFFALLIALQLIAFGAALILAGLSLRKLRKLSAEMNANRQMPNRRASTHESHA